MRSSSVKRKGLAAVAMVLLGVVGPTVTASGVGGDGVPVLREVRIARHDTFDHE